MLNVYKMKENYVERKEKKARKEHRINRNHMEIVV